MFYHYVFVFFLQVLWFPPTVQNMHFWSIGDSNLPVGVCESKWCVCSTVGYKDNEWTKAFRVLPRCLNMNINVVWSVRYMARLRGRACNCSASYVATYVLCVFPPRSLFFVQDRWCECECASAWQSASVFFLLQPSILSCCDVQFLHSKTYVRCLSPEGRRTLSTYRCDSTS